MSSILCNKLFLKAYVAARCAGNEPGKEHAERYCLPTVINGGVKTLAQARSLLPCLDGVMIGREAYQNPWMLAGADSEIFGDRGRAPTRREVLQGFAEYAERQLADGVPLSAMTRHVLGLFNGRPGARAWRRHISDNSHRPQAGPELLLAAAPGAD
jgi:tRNA-dihydrouridine synthase A